MVPDPPVTIDLSAGGGGAWPAFTISGVTGDAEGLNTTYDLHPFEGEWIYSNGDPGPGITRVSQSEPNEWSISLANVVQFTGSGTWPWTVASWVPQNDGAGTPAFARTLASPVSLDLAGDVAAVEAPVSLVLDSAGMAVAATLPTNLTGSNNDLNFTSVLAGRLGNDVTVRYVSPGTNDATLGVVVAGRDITVNLATNGAAAITSTAAQVKTAVEGSAAAAALVAVAHKAGNDGTGVVTAMSATALSGGTGGLPLPPVAMSL